MPIGTLAGTITFPHRDQARAPVGIPVGDEEVVHGAGFFQGRTFLQDIILGSRRSGQNVHFSSVGADLGFLDCEKVRLAAGATFSRAE